VAGRGRRLSCARYDELGSVPAVLCDREFAFRPTGFTYSTRGRAIDVGSELVSIIVCLRVNSTSPELEATRGMEWKSNIFVAAVPPTCHSDGLVFPEGGSANDTSTPSGWVLAVNVRDGVAPTWTDVARRGFSPASTIERAAAGEYSMVPAEEVASVPIIIRSLLMALEMWSGVRGGACSFEPVWAGVNVQSSKASMSLGTAWTGSLKVSKIPQLSKLQRALTRPLPWRAAENIGGALFVSSVAATLPAAYGLPAKSVTVCGMAIVYLSPSVAGVCSERRTVLPVPDAIVVVIGFPDGDVTENVDWKEAGLRSSPKPSSISAGEVNRAAGGAGGVLSMTAFPPPVVPCSENDTGLSPSQVTMVNLRGPSGIEPETVRSRDQSVRSPPLTINTEPSASVILGAQPEGAGRSRPSVITILSPVFACFFAVLGFVVPSGLCTDTVKDCGELASSATVLCAKRESRPNMPVSCQASRNS